MLKLEFPPSRHSWIASPTPLVITRKCREYVIFENIMSVIALVLYNSIRHSLTLVNDRHCIHIDLGFTYTKYQYNFRQFSTIFSYFSCMFSFTGSTTIWPIEIHNSWHTRKNKGRIQFPAAAIPYVSIQIPSFFHRVNSNRHHHQLRQPSRPLNSAPAQL